jgi:hypothetical protein
LPSKEAEDRVATAWSRNLRAAGQGTLRHHGQVEDFTAVEVPPEQRAPLIEAYLRRYGKAPGVRASFEQLPDPAEHPTSASPRSPRQPHDTPAAQPPGPLDRATRR